MITQYHYKKVTWIDLENPTAEDIAILIKDYALHPNWGNELLVPSERAKTDTHEHAFYAVLHYPDHPSYHHESRDLEIDYVVTDKVLITAHYEPIDIFLDTAKKISVENTLDHHSVGNGFELFLMLNNHLYRGLREEIEPLQKEIRRIESEIFQGNEFHMVKELSSIQRKLLDFKQTMRTHKIILHSLELQAHNLVPKIEINQDTIFREYFRVENTLENNYELVKELRDTNDSLLTSKNNDITKRFTMMAFFTFPLTLIAMILLAPESPAIFHTEHGFWIIIVILLVFFVFMYGYFAHKKWL